MSYLSIIQAVPEQRKFNLPAGALYFQKISLSLQTHSTFSEVIMDNKTLIELVSRRSGINKKDSARMLEALAAAISRVTSASDTVARVMAVPSTGKRLLLPPKITLGFKPAALFKQQLRNPDK